MNLNKFPTALQFISESISLGVLWQVMYYTVTQTIDTRSAVPIQHLWSNSPQDENGASS